MKALVRTGRDMLGVLCGVVIVTFFFMHWLPGDPAQLYAGEQATAEEIALIRQRMGLDRPLIVQFVAYVRNLAQGDLGISLRSGRPVVFELAERLSVTIRLTAASTVISLAAAFILGLATSLNPRSRLAYAAEWIGLFFLAVPVFWLGLIFILLFSVVWRWFPPGGFEDWKHIVLPALTLGISTGAATAQVLKASIHDVMGKVYLVTARGKGASSARTLWLHALPNALIPTLTYFSMEIGRMLGGAVLTETVFAINGVGRYLVQSIAFRDYPVVLGSVLFIAVAVTLANAIGDFMCTLVDPRRRSNG